MAAWWLSLPADTQTAMMLGLVTALTPLLVALLRRVWPRFDIGPARQKWLASALVAFVGAYLVTPGDLRTRVLAGVAAILAAQGAYNTAQVALGRRDAPGRAGP